MAAISEPSEIVKVVKRQLWEFTYTCPIAPNVSIHSNPKFSLTLCCQSQGLPRQTQPYRNDRITTVIRGLFFTGGSTAFATRFDEIFMRDGDPLLNREVPMAMVGLVSTGVSYKVNLSVNPILNHFLSSMLLSISGRQENDTTSTSARTPLLTYMRGT